MSAGDGLRDGADGGDGDGGDIGGGFGFGSGDLIDRIVDGTTVRWGLLVTSIFGAIYYGLILGIVDVIGTIRDGVTETLDDLSIWLADSFIGGLFDPAADALSSAWIEASQFADSFGAMAPIVSILIVGVTIMIGLVGMDAVVHRIREVFSL